MNRLLVVVVALCGVAFAQDGSSDFCTAYADCVDKAQTKSNECAAEAPAEASCEEAKPIQDELLKLWTDRNSATTSCVREKTSEAEVLTGKKADKCAAFVKKISKRSPAETSRREKRRAQKRNRGGACAKEAKRLRQQCAKLAKCCTVVKGCNDTSNKDTITAKRTQLRDAQKQCRKTNRKNKKQGRKAAAETTDSSRAKKRSTPIGGRKLEMAIVDSEAH